MRLQGTEPMKCGIYQHYKGGFYLLIGEAEHTETKERLAIYVSLDPTLSGPRIRARPLHEFIGYVGACPRFDFVGDRP